MDLYVPHPFAVTYPHTRMTVVRTRIPIMFTHRQDLDRLTVCGALLKAFPQRVFPYIVQ